MIAPGIQFPGAIVSGRICLDLWNWQGARGYRRSPMDCRTFRSLHGDWVDDVVDPTEGDALAGHIAECGGCARFDALSRRAMMVARNAPPIELSVNFSARLAERIAVERRRRIADHKPSHVERARLIAGSPTWVRVAAAVVVVVGGSVAMRSISRGESQATAVWQGTDSTGAAWSGASASYMSAIPGASGGEIVVVRSMRPVGGTLLPASNDPLLDGSERSVFGDVTAASVAVTAPLWPTAQMAAHAANRFAATEFGDVMPVSVMQTSR